MDDNDIGQYAIVIISADETVKGTITAVLNEDIFEIESSNGMISRWNLRQIKGIKFKGGR